MSKVKLRSLTEICGDCSALEPGWASINRCILLCDECCSIHRSLGRHVSQVKSLKKGIWSQHQLQMVKALNNSGANSIWEHTLLDPSNSKGVRRKPQPQDPLHTIKADFIRAKHQQLSFVFRPSKDEIVTDDADLSQQLHSSVRTNNLETSLRLLSQGADPNFFHSVKCTTPLHVAAQAGQISQVELLIVYGANPNAEDQHGRTPAYYARCAGHRDLAERIIECLYEVTDRLTLFVCGKKPDHLSGQHLILPEKADCGELAEIAREAKIKLQQLPNQLFEELVTDVYDEVDRRNTEEVWLSGPIMVDNAPVPFLPVNPELSSTRNQGRQKLARFSGSEFSALILDILADTRRRQNHDSALTPVSMTSMPHRSELSDDDPLYDSVASDEDYVTAEQLAKCLKVVVSEKSSSASNNEPSIHPSDLTGPVEKVAEYGRNSVEQELRRKLAESEATIEEMQSEIYRLQTTIRKLESENVELRRLVPPHSHSLPFPNGHEPEPLLQATHMPVQRPSSMYEPREGLRSTPWGGTKNQLFQGSVVSMPLPKEVMSHTDQVTKRVQELWVSMKEQSSNNSNSPGRDTFVSCADRIRGAVADLVAIFPKNPTDETVCSSLRSLMSHTARLQTDCASLEGSLGTERTVCLQHVRDTAYGIAKATKQIVSTQLEPQRHSPLQQQNL